MNIRYVTITGADDSTRVDNLVALSKEYPFVEWGILVSRRQEGTPRFPTRGWVEKFTGSVPGGVNVSMHVCGQWVRRTLIGESVWHEIPGALAYRAQRVQINTHAEVHGSKVAMVGCLREIPAREIIFQWDGVNDHLAHAMAGYGLNTSALFDTSGGAGALPPFWPSPDPALPCGYAGGLGPDNVVDNVRKIAALCGPTPFWIDMERRVRSDDDAKLDLDKVERVLRAVVKHRMAGTEVAQ